MNGKGSTQRPSAIPKSTYDQNYSRTFYGDYGPSFPADQWDKQAVNMSENVPRETSVYPLGHNDR